MQVNIISKSKRSSDKSVPKTYVASEKDSLYSLCKLIYGNWNNLRTLEKLNNHAGLAPLSEGEVILLA